MSYENLSSQQKDRLRAAKSLEEMEELAAEEGFELSDEQLDGIVGGGDINCLEKDLYPSLENIDCPPFMLDTTNRPS